MVAQYGTCLAHHSLQFCPVSVYRLTCSWLFALMPFACYAYILHSCPRAHLAQWKLNKQTMCTLIPFLLSLPSHNISLSLTPIFAPQSWTVQPWGLVYTDRISYSTMAELPDGKIAVLFERGTPTEEYRYLAVAIATPPWAA